MRPSIRVTLFGYAQNPALIDSGGCGFTQH
jgi:hypothetical protein